MKKLRSKGGALVSNIAKMKACKRIKLLLSAYADGVISTREKGRVEKHLAQCPECARLLQDLTDIKEVMLTIPAPETPPYLVTRIQAQLRQEQKKFKPRQVLTPVWQLLGAILVIFAIGLGIMLGSALARTNGIYTEISFLNAEPSLDNLFVIENAGQQ